MNSKKAKRIRVLNASKLLFRGALPIRGGEEK